MSSSAPPFIIERLATPTGDILVVTDEQASVIALDFAEFEARLRHRMLRRYRAPELASIKTGSSPLPVREALQAYFAGATQALDVLKVQTGGTAFQELVWSALRRTPSGTTLSYGQLAAVIGRPSAVRAVGLANGANPIALIVPCHRIIGTNGTLTGYAGGLDRKRWLLEHERLHATHTGLV